MLTGIDHLVILAPDLERAMGEYQSLGFTVLRGGEHPGGTHNALIAFGDGTYLELIAFADPNATQHRWHRFIAAGGGLVDFAMGSTDLVADVARLTAAGLPYRLMDGARRRPDGVELQWRSASVDPAGLVPFVIEDVTPRGLRVASGTDAEHHNHITGVLSITIAVADLAAATQRYSALLDTAPIIQKQNDTLGGMSVTFLTGQSAIELVQPDDAASPLAAQIAARGDGPYSACLTVDPSTQESTLLDPAKTAGARLDVIAPKAEGA